MDTEKIMVPDMREPEIKTIQTKVVKGKGCEDFFLEVDFDFPVGTPFYIIESVNTWVDVYDAQVIRENKVIFNAWVYKNIIYKTVSGSPVQETEGGVTVSGGVDHMTKSIHLAGCINIDTKGCDKLNPKEDSAEVLKAYVIGDVEEKLGETEIKDGSSSYKPPIYVYGKLHEKMCVKVEVKVVRWEHVKIEVEGKC